MRARAGCQIGFRWLRFHSQHVKTVRKGKTMINGLKRKEEPPPAIATKNPGDFNLGSLESRVAARALAERRKDSGIRVRIFCIGSKRPENKPKPKYRNGFIEEYYSDDNNYPED